MPERVDVNRRHFVRVLGGVAVATLTPAASLCAQSGRTVTVYKEPTCGCCGGWVRHMTKAGFAVTALDVSDIGAIKTKHEHPRCARDLPYRGGGSYLVEEKIRPCRRCASSCNARPKP